MYPLPPRVKEKYRPGIRKVEMPGHKNQLDATLVERKNSTGVKPNCGKVPIGFGIRFGCV